MANVPHSYCPFRDPHTPGALAFCNDECSLYIRNTKLPPQKSCAFSLMGVQALQKIIVTQHKSETAAAPAAPAPPDKPPETPPRQ